MRKFKRNISSFLASVMVLSTLLTSVVSPSVALADDSGGAPESNWVSVKNAIAAFQKRTLIMDKTGQVYAWGTGTNYALTNGSTTQQNSPVLGMKLDNIKMFASGEQHTVFLTNDGKVYTTGSNSQGQLGIGTSGGSSSELNEVTALSDKHIVQVAAGNEFSVALDSEGNVYTWGNSKYIGGGARPGSNTLPAKINFDAKAFKATEAVSIGAGTQTGFAVLTNGKLVGWGDSYYGQVVNIPTMSGMDRIMPDAVPLSATNIVKVAGGNMNAFALTADGKLYGWGGNILCTLSNSSCGTTYYAPDVKLTNVVDFFAGNIFVVAITKNGDVYVWGDKRLTNASSDSANPVKVSGISNAVAVGGGASHAVVITRDKKVYTWGIGSGGQLGLGSTANYTTPQQVNFPGDFFIPPDNFTSFSSSNLTTNSVKLTWGAVGGATLYELYRDGGIEPIYSGTATTFTDINLTKGTLYTYKVRASNSDGGTWSPELQVRTYIEAPTSVMAYKTSPTSIKITWSPSPDATDGYSLMRGTTELLVDDPMVTEFEDTGLATNTNYTYTLVAKSGEATSAPITISATTRVQIPSAPSSLNASGITSVGATLTWTSANYTQEYILKRNGVEIYRGTALTYTDTTAAPGTTYTYAVQASNIDGLSSERTTSVTTLAAPPSKPASAPVSGAVTNESATINWDAVPGATGYKLYRDGVLVYEGSDLSFTDTGLTADTQYTYTYSAVNAQGEGGMSDPLVVRTNPNAPAVAPSNLTVGTVTLNSVSLSWDAVPGADTYVLRRDGVAVYTGSDLSFVDTGVTENSTYSYTVEAVNVTGAGPASTPVLVTTPFGTVGTPATFGVSATTSSTITLTWSAVGNATGYKVLRDGVEVYDGTATTFTDTGLESNTAYVYTLIAYNPVGESSPKTATASTETEPVSTPDNLTASDITNDSITLTWDGVTGATSYIVKRNGLTVYEGASITFKDTGLSENTSYTYQVYAKKGNSLSSPAVLSLQTDNKPKTPPVMPPSSMVDFRVVQATSNSILLEWNTVTEATYYEIRRDGVLVYSGTDSTFLDTGLEETTTYLYSLISANDYGSSSAISLTATTQGSVPVTPTGLKANRIYPESVVLQWNLSQKATEYIVKRDGSVIVYVGPLTTFEDTTVTQQTYYEYTVQARNAYGLSADSAPITVYTPEKTDPIQIVIPNEPPITGKITFSFQLIHGAYEYHVERNPHWTYIDNGDGTFSVTYENEVTGEYKSLGTVVPVDGYLPFEEDGVPANATYHYDIIAVVRDADGNGTVIGEDSVTITTPPATDPGNPSDPGNGGGTPSDPGNGGGTPGGNDPSDPGNGGGTPGGNDPSDPGNGGGTPGGNNPSDPGNGGGAPGGNDPSNPGNGGGTPGGNNPSDPGNGGTPGGNDPSNPADPGNGGDNNPTNPGNVGGNPGSGNPSDPSDPSDPGNGGGTPGSGSGGSGGGSTPSTPGSGGSNGDSGNGGTNNGGSNGGNGSGSPENSTGGNTGNTPGGNSGSAGEDKGSGESGGLTDIENHWAEDAIKELYKRGIITGYPDKTFKPNQKITRAEFTKMLVLALSSPEVDRVMTFKDVATKDWFYPYVFRAYGNYLVKGFSAEEFRPNALINREQMFTIVSRSTSRLDKSFVDVDNIPLSKAEGVLAKFKDLSSISGWAKPPVSYAVQAGLVVGDLESNLNPKADGTRAEAAMLIYNLLKKFGL